MAGYTALKGDIHIEGSSVTTLEGLECLKSISGDLTISNTRIENLTGLENLTNVGGKLKISRNSKLCQDLAMDFSNRVVAMGTVTVTGNKICH